jgi:polysaccharide pyruvyl transferase WcaK-like protein
VNHKEPRLFEKTAEFLDGIIEKQNAKILFFANEVREGESFDKAASQKAIACMKHKDQAVMIPNEYRTPQQTLSLVSCCQLTVSMRYHFCLFSALQSVPFIALKRSDKVDDLCWDMDWTYGITMDNFTPTELMDRFSALEENRKSVIAHLRNQVQSMRTRALTNHLALDALLDKNIYGAEMEGLELA